MRKLQSLFTLYFIVTFFAFFQTAFSQYTNEEPVDKTLSPYFFVQSDNDALDQMPLKSTGAEVTISGVIANVKVTQVYKNEGKRTIEATYVFPASTRAAVYAMKMTIGERVIEAKIKEREQARQDYNEAKAAGKTASLLEQQRPNVFQMNVANILPDDEIKVELQYTELLVPTDHVYEFVYPTVVGPRYSNQPESSVDSHDKFVKSPYLTEGKLPNYEFNLTTTIHGGVPVSEVSSPSHKIKTSFIDRSRVSVSIDPSEVNSGNRDFILKYRLDGDKVQTGLLLFEGEKENFFLLMAQPAKKVKADEIPPREYIFILDVSGSMHGYPIETEKKLVEKLLKGLRSEDRFNIVLFASGMSVYSDASIRAKPEEVTKAIQFIDKQPGSGGTEILPALESALKLPKSEGYSRTIIVSTDGYVNVEPQAFSVIRKHLHEANLFAFGIGTAVNRFIIEGMAHAGMGEPFVIVHPTDIEKQTERFYQMINSPVLTGVEVSYSGFDAYDIEPQSIPDVFSERPVIVFGKWRGTRAGLIKIQGQSGRGEYSSSLLIGKAGAPDNAALPYLWARERIKLLSDYSGDPHYHGYRGMNRTPDAYDKLDQKTLVKEVTKLGLDYNLLTAYTSFIAVDTKVRNEGGKQISVEQPLPLPQGVSNLAVGNSMGGSSSAMLLGVTAGKRSMLPDTKGSTGSNSSVAAPSTSTSGGRALQELSVTAEKPRVELQSSTGMSSIATKPGVKIDREGGIHVRGGRASEVVFIDSVRTVKVTFVGKSPVMISGSEKARTSEDRSDSAFKSVWTNYFLQQWKICYATILQTDSNLAGKITIRFTIKEDGTTSDIIVQSSEWNKIETGNALENCLRESIRKAHFDPLKPGDGDVIVELSCRFEK